MNKVIKNEFRKAFVNKGFFVVIAIEVVLVLWYTYEEVIPVITEQIPLLKQYLEAGSGISLPGAYSTWIAFSVCKQRIILYAIIPILAAIPYGASLFFEEGNHYIYHIFTHMERKNYYLAKLVALFLSGGVVAATPFVLSFVINTLLLPLENVRPFVTSNISSITMYSELFYTSPLLYVLWHITATFICFGLFNCLCFVATYIFENRFLVVVFPFAIYYVSRVLGDVLFEGRNRTPWFLFRLNDFWRSDLRVAIVWMLGLIVAILGTLLYVSRKRGDKL